MMEMHPVHGVVGGAEGPNCRILLSGKDRTILPTSDVGSNTAVLCRGLHVIHINFPPARIETRGETTAAQKATIDHD
jgi:hypothetical protein